MKPILRRRDLFRAFAGTALAAPATRILFAASDFWNRKPPDAWTGDQIEQLTTRSPWAKETNIDFAEEEGGHLELPSSNGAPPSQQGMPPGTIGTIPMGRTDGGVMRRAPVIVRWDSAQPLLDALHGKVPNGFEDRYVLSVSHLPARVMNPRGRREFESSEADLLEQLKASATLEAKGREPVGPGIVKRETGGDPTWYFGFAKDLLPLSASDKEILFTLHTGRVAVKARFVPKEMMYRGRLAV
ncbi:MAG TPA: hypothetical protein VHB50_22660 [Bryobacteraceae bacterium]|nr:hypothetical protein [Bryobacteraceae bacterium]